MKYDIPAALQALKPGAEWVLRGDQWSGLEWMDTKQSVPTEKEVTDKIAELDAAEGMKIETMNQKVEEGRKLVNEFLLINHPLDCPICDQSGECSLQDYSFEYGSGKSEMDLLQTRI